MRTTKTLAALIQNNKSPGKGQSKLMHKNFGLINGKRPLHPVDDAAPLKIAGSSCVTQPRFHKTRLKKVPNAHAVLVAPANRWIA